MNAIFINATPHPLPLQHVMTAKKYEYIQIVRCVITHRHYFGACSHVSRSSRPSARLLPTTRSRTLDIRFGVRAAARHASHNTDSKPPSFGGGGGKSTIARDDVELKNRAWHLWLWCLDCLAHREGLRLRTCFCFVAFRKRAQLFVRMGGGGGGV